MTVSKGQYLGEFELICMLSVMRCQPNAYGVTVFADIDRQTRREPNIGAIYATLDRLEEKGLLCSKQGESTPVRGGRPKRYYYVKPAGVEAVRTSKTMLDQMFHNVNLDDPDE